MADDEIETSFLGIPVKARGINTIGMVIMAGALAFSLWLLYTGTVTTREQYTAIQETLVSRADEHKEMMIALHSMAEAKASTSAAINEQNYIILSDPAERERIKKAITMPQSLREKLNR